MPLPGPGCNCPVQVCTTATGTCACDGSFSYTTLTGVVVTVTDPSGATVSTGAAGECLSFAVPVAGAYTVTAVWNGLQTLSKTVNLSPCVPTTNVAFTFIDRVAGDVYGCAGGIAGATVTCGEASTTTDVAGHFCLDFSNALPASNDIGTLPVTVKLATGPERTQTPLVLDGVPIGCRYLFYFVDRFCINITGCNETMAGAQFELTCGSDSFAGAYDGSGNMCFTPTTDWDGQTATLTASKPYYATGSTSTSIVYNTTCGITLSLNPLPCYVCCECGGPLPTTINLTDVNGVHQLVYAPNPGTCQWLAAYTAPIPAADAALEYTTNRNSARMTAILDNAAPDRPEVLTASCSIAPSA